MTSSGAGRGAPVLDIDGPNLHTMTLELRPALVSRKLRRHEENISVMLRTGRKLREIGCELAIVARRDRCECFGPDPAGFHAHNVEIKRGMGSRRKTESTDIGVQA